MKVIITKNYSEMSAKAAHIIAGQIILNDESVIGLATGSTPLGTYEKLREIYQEGMIDFSRVTSFNLDEYLGLSPENPQSYHYFMEENFFRHINIPTNQTFVPEGTTANMEQECFEYEQKILDCGGIDLQLLGIGHNGHIGFNEPGDKFIKKTHLVNLDQQTIEANARFFESSEQVPTQAVTMGIQTIMNARKIVLIASGQNKAEIVQKTIQGEITPSVPGSILQLHPDVTFVLDQDAAALLK